MITEKDMVHLVLCMVAIPTLCLVVVIARRCMKHGWRQALWELRQATFPPHDD